MSTPSSNTFNAELQNALHVPHTNMYSFTKKYKCPQADLFETVLLNLLENLGNTAVILQYVKMSSIPANTKLQCINEYIYKHPILKEVGEQFCSQMLR